MKSTNRKLMISLMLVSIGVMLGRLVCDLGAQSRLDSGSQVSPRPAIVLAEFWKCQGPGGAGSNCSGIGFVRLKFSDGAESKVFTSPADPAFVPSGSSWMSIPVTLPSGPTAVPCNQTKP